MWLPTIDATRIHALRGYKTADHLVRNGYKVPDVPFGDPGILVSEFFEPEATKGGSTRKEVVIVPHHSTYKGWQSSRYGHSTEIDILDPCTNSSDFLNRIYHADVVISESLHGIIFASAFGKKVTWIADSDMNLFKYHDWFSTVEQPRAAPLGSSLPVEDLVRAAEACPHRIDSSALKAAFPHEVAVELPSRGRVGYRAAREHNPFCFFFHDQHRDLSRPDMPPLHFFDVAKSVADNIFSTWDERPYAVGVNHRHGVLPNRQQLAAMVFEMDHHHNHDFAVIATKEQIWAAGLDVFPMGNDVFWATGWLKDVSAVLIRPSGNRNGEGYVIFCV